MSSNTSKLDFDDELEKVVIRKTSTEAVAFKGTIHECVPLLLHDVLSVEVMHCEARKKHFTVFNKNIHFKTCVVLAKLITPLQSRSKSGYLRGEIDDTTGRLTVFFDTNSTALKDLDSMESLDISTSLKLQIKELRKVFDPRSITKFTTLLIHAIPYISFNELTLAAISFYVPDRLEDDFEIFYKSIIIDWYYKNKPSLKIK